MNESTNQEASTLKDPRRLPSLRLRNPAMREHVRRRVFELKLRSINEYLNLLIEGDAERNPPAK